ncbi:hypothetical protein GCM10023340_34910 [Nocardioides marinquilinus]|uniref:Uncharacterized protein n=1 Tax=Nocardioides marinquilinus TaxID=1210400 RepID=A0ABP9PW35_9ACTN
MDQDLSVPAWVLLVVLAALVVTGLLVAWLVRRSRARAAAALGALQQQVEAIEQRLAAAERPEPAPVRRDEREYVVTTLARPDAEADADATPVPTVPAPMFADLVLREGVVQAASLAAGLRRALAPETRHRIRFEMRREVKRARKQRRADVRQARREVEARQRARVRDAA